MTGQGAVQKNQLALAWTIARRELRGGVHGFRIFIACLALGVAAIAGVGSLSSSIVAGLQADSRKLLGGDVDLALQHTPATDRQLAYLKANTQALSKTSGMRAMAQPDAKSAPQPTPGQSQRAMVELKAVDGLYPLVGALEVEPPLPLDQILAPDGDGWGAAAEANLLSRLGLAVGDWVRIGDARFRLKAVITREPDRVAGILSFGPRVMISSQALAQTGLVQPGSQVHFHYRAILPPGIGDKAWIEDIEEAFPKAGWRVRGADGAAPNVRRFIERMTLFLTFVGLTALLVGGIGVTGAVGSYLDGKTATIATLKCLGAPGGLVFRIYLLQILVLSLGGILIGLGVGVFVPLAVLGALAGQLPVQPIGGFYLEPVGKAAVFGLITALTFTLWPLARASAIPAASLFRDRVAPSHFRVGRKAVAAMGAGVLALALLTVFTASDRGFALWFVGGAMITLLALRLGANLVVDVARRLPRPRNPVWRLVQTNLYRPDAATMRVVLSLGLGVSVLVAIGLIEGNLKREITSNLPESAPALFFLDIQPQQVKAFDATVTAVPGTSGLQRMPTLRGRITAIGGVPVEQVDIDPHVAWAVRGDRVLTFAARPAEHAEIVDGEWWSADYSGPPAISLDAELARGFGVGVGDTLTLNVLGRDIEATIANTRRINWRSLRFDFAIIFAPGVLEGAPYTHIAAINAPADTEEAVENAIAKDFRNVTAIRVREALEAASRILAGVGTAVRGSAAIALIAGVLVLAGTIAAGHRRRVYDAVVFKVLGATRRRIVAGFVLEYGVLGVVTGIIAAGVGTVTAWAVIVYLMSMTWTFLPGVVAIMIVGSLGLTVAAGLAGTWRILGQKAAPYLRNE